MWMGQCRLLSYIGPWNVFGVSQSQGVPCQRETERDREREATQKFRTWCRLTCSANRLTHRTGVSISLRLCFFLFNGNPNYAEARPLRVILPPDRSCKRHIPCSMFHVLRVFFFWGEMKNFALKLIEGCPALTPRSCTCPSTPGYPWVLVDNVNSILMCYF